MTDTSMSCITYSRKQEARGERRFCKPCLQEVEPGIQWSQLANQIQQLEQRVPIDGPCEATRRQFENQVPVSSRHTCNLGPNESSLRLWRPQVVPGKGSMKQTTAGHAHPFALCVCLNLEPLKESTNTRFSDSDTMSNDQYLQRVTHC